MRCGECGSDNPFWEEVLRRLRRAAWEPLSQVRCRKPQRQEVLWRLWDFAFR
jgi:hypothetical protein